MNLNNIVLEAQHEEASSEITRSKLEAIGGRYWESNDRKRVYFNDIAARLGLTYRKYKTGNISDAWIDGEKISNSQATQILGFQVWYDLVSQSFMYRASDESLAQKVIDSIRKEIQQGSTP